MLFPGLDSGTPEGRAHAHPHAIPSTLHAMCTPTIGVHMASRRAEPARLSGGRAKPARPLDRRAGLARL